MAMQSQEYRQKLQVIAASLDSNRKKQAASMIWELYRDKILTSSQASETLVCMGFTVVKNGRTGELECYK